MQEAVTGKTHTVTLDDDNNSVARLSASDWVKDLPYENVTGYRFNYVLNGDTENPATVETGDPELLVDNLNVDNRITWAIIEVETEDGISGNFDFTIQELDASEASTISWKDVAFQGFDGKDYTPIKGIKRYHLVYSVNDGAAVDVWVDNTEYTVPKEQDVITWSITEVKVGDEAEIVAVESVGGSTGAGGTVSWADSTFQTEAQEAVTDIKEYHLSYSVNGGAAVSYWIKADEYTMPEPEAKLDDVITSWNIDAIQVNGKWITLAPQTQEDNKINVSDWISNYKSKCVNFIKE